MAVTRNIQRWLNNLNYPLCTLRNSNRLCSWNSGVYTMETRPSATNILGFVKNNPSNAYQVPIVLQDKIRADCSIPMPVGVPVCMPIVCSNAYRCSTLNDFITRLNTSGNYNYFIKLEFESTIFYASSYFILDNNYNPILIKIIDPSNNSIRIEISSEYLNYNSNKLTKFILKEVLNKCLELNIPITFSNNLNVYFEKNVESTDEVKIPNECIKEKIKQTVEDIVSDIFYY